MQAGFCAGADLQQVADDDGTQESTDDGSEQLGGTFNRALTDLMDCPVPTVAKVNGAAAGGGFGLGLVLRHYNCRGISVLCRHLWAELRHRAGYGHDLESASASRVAHAR